MESQHLRVKLLNPTTTTTYTELVGDYATSCAPMAGKSTSQGRQTKRDG